VGKMQGHQIPNPCDGAEWIWNLVALHFSDAIQIVDLYHARQHLWEVARKLYPHDEGEQKAWMKIHQKHLLDRGKIEKLVGALRSIESDRSEEHTSELQSPYDLVCRLLLEKKKK